MRVAVVGAGAMGGALAAEATAAGADVFLVETAAGVVDHIRRHGLVVEEAAGRRRVEVPVTGDPAEVGAVDLAVLFVKAHHTRSAAATVARVLAPGGVAVTLQNGWGNADLLARALPPRQLVLGVTYHSCSAAGPGHVRHTGRGPTLVGPYDAGAGAAGAGRVVEFLTAAGWEARVAPDVRTEIWRKLVLNAATLPVAALTRLPAEGLDACPPVSELVDALAAEAVAVGRAQGFDIAVAERVERIHAVLAAAGTGKPSMLQDVEAARRTEIEVVNGAVARLGAQLGIETPLNQAMAALVSGVERSWAR